MKTFWITALFAVVIAVSAVGQNVNQLVSFTAPATFYAGNAKLPAGAYTISQMSAQNGDMCEITSGSGQHSVLLDCRNSSKSQSGNAPEVQFNRYGNTDFLEGVLAPEGRSVDFIQQTAEKLAAKSGTAQPHKVPAK